MSHLSTSAKLIAVAASLIGSPALTAVPLTDNQLGGVSAGTQFSVANAVADRTATAPVIDPSLINPWGMSAAPGGDLWVSNNGSNTSTVYAPGTFSLELSVNVPGAPTGTAYISAPNAFDISEGGKSGGSQFAFATIGGQILGWNANVDPNNAVVAVNQAGQQAVFTGLTYGTAAQSPRLFAADFAHGVVKAFDTNFGKVGRFTDPALPANFSPFNVKVLNNELYVAYAMHNPGSATDIAGQGLGYVDVFDTQGNLLRRLIPAGGKLNAPWGLAIAPASFGQFAGALLVGNFGNGKINAYDPQTGAFLGQVQDAAGAALVLKGLWALRQGPNGTLQFTAGPVNGTHGRIGVISPIPDAPPLTTTSPPATPPPATPTPTPTPVTPMPTTPTVMPMTPAFGYQPVLAAILHR